MHDFTYYYNKQTFKLAIVRRYSFNDMDGSGFSTVSIFPFRVKVMDVMSFTETFEVEVGVHFDAPEAPQDAVDRNLKEWEQKSHLVS